MPYSITPFAARIKGLIKQEADPDKVAQEVADTHEYVMAAICLASLWPLLPQGKVATVLYPGIVPEQPLAESVKVCRALQSPMLLVAGHHLAYTAGSGQSEDGRTHEYYSDASVQKHLAQGGLPDLPFATQVHARHTAHQAEWVVDQVIEHGLMAIALQAAPGHLFPRAFCTQLKAFLKRGRQVLIIPVPHAMHPYEDLQTVFSQSAEEDSDNFVSQVRFHPGEHAWVLDYSQKQPVADVATLAELREYCTWVQTEHRFFQ